MKITPVFILALHSKDLPVPHWLEREARDIPSVMEDV
jgi:hypothetical protein